MSDKSNISNLAEVIINELRNRNMKIVTAESCTGGLIASTLTDISGSSDAVHGGFVTYANDAKTNMLGVDSELIKTHGAVSAEVAKAMATGALENSSADIAIAVTGIAGPTGGTAEKPVGLVHMAVAMKTQNDTVQSHARHERHERHEFGNEFRTEIKKLSVEKALTLALNQIMASD